MLRPITTRPNPARSFNLLISKSSINPQGFTKSRMFGQPLILGTSAKATANCENPIFLFSIFQFNDNRTHILPRRRDQANNGGKNFPHCEKPFITPQPCLLQVLCYFCTRHACTSIFNYKFKPLLYLPAVSC